jgi:hypothetical protein
LVRKAEKLGQLGLILKTTGSFYFMVPQNTSNSSCGSLSCSW